jgi:hypothetical protein
VSHNRWKKRRSSTYKQSSGCSILSYAGLMTIAASPSSIPFLSLESRWWRLSVLWSLRRFSAFHFHFFIFKTFMESFSYLLLFLVSYFFSYSLVDYNDMFIYLVGLFYIGKYLMFSFVACFSKLYCLFVIVQTLYVLNFDSSIIAAMSGLLLWVGW